MAKKQTVSCGIDIGISSLKFVRLNCLKEKAELLGFALEQGVEDLPAALKRLKETYRIESAQVSLSGAATVTRYVAFPKMAYLDLMQALKFEAQKYIPFSLSDVNLDAHILRDDLSENKMLILLCAAKKDAVGQRLRLFEGAGIKINSLGIDALALVNSFAANRAHDEAASAKPAALLNIGAGASNLVILEGGMPRLSRDIHIGGNNFTQRLAEALNIGLKEAEQLKLNPDAPLPAVQPQPATAPAEGQAAPAEGQAAPAAGQAPPKFEEIIEPVVNNLGAELRTSFDYYESQAAAAVTTVFLSGGSSALRGLKDALGSALGAKVELWEPFKGIPPASGVNAQELRLLQPRLAVAAGLALAR
jgi:type IV pilus assembly protein PilM